MEAATLNLEVWYIGTCLVQLLQSKRTFFCLCFRLPNISLWKNISLIC